MENCAAFPDSISPSSREAAWESPDVQAHGLQIPVVLVTAAPNIPPDMSLNALSDNCLRAVKSKHVGFKKLPDTFIYTTPSALIKEIRKTTLGESPFRLTDFPIFL